MTVDDFNALGFEYGDSVDVEFSNGYKLDALPYYFENTDFAASAEEYLKAAGMSKERIEALRTHLTAAE